MQILFNYLYFNIDTRFGFTFDQTLICSIIFNHLKVFCENYQYSTIHIFIQIVSLENIFMQIFFLIRDYKLKSV